MSKKIVVALITGVLVASSHISVGLAQAPENEDRPKEQREIGMKDKNTMGLNRLDQDGDGMISKNEFMQAHEERFSRMDQDGDGIISKNEFTQVHEKIFSRMDQDGDGMLDVSDIKRGKSMMRDCMMNC